jgi:hypothetical protein
MSEWRRKVREALKNPAVVQGIAQVAAAWMKEHIDENQGRSRSGSVVKHAPLKRVVGRYWAKSKPKKGFLFKRRRTDANGKTRTFYRVESVGYRFGGQPLRDTGKLQRSLSATGTASGNSVSLTMRGLKYGLYQDRGFKTVGPNYIPLTMKGKRQHGTGNNPNSEGLTRGKDYILVGNKKRRTGVTVPARPFIMPTRSDLRMFGKSVYLGLRSVLRGR